MDNMFVVTFRRLGEFLDYCKVLFASKTMVDQNDADINTYVLEIDYKNTLAFDTTEIVQ